MLKNYLTVALRHLRKQKGFAAINLFGLAAGVSCCLLITLFVREEVGYDRFHDNADRLFRMWQREELSDGEVLQSAITPVVLGPSLAAAFPEIEAVVRLDTYEELVGVDRPTLPRQFLYADSLFFSAFSFPLLRGDPATALLDPGGVVLSASTARELFGDADPMGRPLRAVRQDETLDLVVTGVAEDAPAASSIQFDLVAPFAAALPRYSEQAQTSWFSVFVETYVLLRPGADAAAFQAKLPAMVRRLGTAALGEDYREGMYAALVQPITDIHLNPEVPPGIQPPSDPRYAAILSAIALFVLLIACINFVTLSVAQSARRAKEVGLRKTLGAERRQLAGQFWGEALVLTALAIVLAFGLAAAALPFFNDLAGRALRLSPDGGTLLFGLGAFLAVGLVAGVYPAVVLSGLAPVQALRDRLQLGGDRSLFRRGLVVVQFALTIFLIAGTLVLGRQLRYLQEKPLGYDEAHVVVVPTNLDIEEARPVLDRLTQALAAEPTVEAVSHAAYLFDEPWIAMDFLAPDGVRQALQVNFGAADFPQALSIPLAAGRYLRPGEPADSAALLVNEALVRQLGLANPVGARLPGDGFPDHEIVGVLRDFHFESLHTAVGPMVYTIDPNRVLAGAGNVNVTASPRRKLAVRLRGGDVAAGLALLERARAAAAPGRPFDYRFLDDGLALQYAQERRLGRITGAASALSILIACLGLFGLAALTVTRRTKEVGVRKVLGASVGSLVVLLTKDFAGLVVVAFAVAAPAAYLVMGRWLDSFAYRVGLGPGAFLLAGGLALAVALLTVGLHTARAASADPVRALRSD